MISIKFKVGLRSRIKTLIAKRYMHSGDGSIGVEVRNLTLYGNPYGFKKRILYEKDSC